MDEITKMYIVDLKTNSSSLCAAVYIETEKGLRPLWPDMLTDFNTKYKGNHEKAAKACFMSIQNSNGDMPKFFFRFNGGGYDKWDECGRSAVAMAKQCGYSGQFEVYALRGAHPSLKYSEY